MLENEPLLVSHAIDKNIFGMHTEQRFKKICRDYSNSTLSFTTINGREINLKFFNEGNKNVNCGHVYVHKSTVLDRPDERGGKPGIFPRGPGAPGGGPDVYIRKMF